MAAGLLLTGGAGRRMGTSKAALSLGGQTLAERAGAALSEVCDPALEVGPGFSRLQQVREEQPLAGPLAAVAAGGAELRRRGYRGPAVVLAVDMPGVTASLIRLIAEQGGDQTTVPLSGGSPQPLCAKYSSADLETAARLVAEGQSSMKALLEAVSPEWIDPAGWEPAAGPDSFADLDTPEDLNRYLRGKSADNCTPANASLLDEWPAGAPARKATASAGVVAFGPSGPVKRRDTLVTEEPMEIRAGGPGQEPVSVAVTMRTPGNDFELAAGFLFTEGLVQQGQVSRIKYCEIPADEQNYNVVTVKLMAPFDKQGLQRNFYATSSCGICGKASLDQIPVVCRPAGAGPHLSPAAIIGMPGALRKAQRIFKKTGGLHAAGLFDREGKLLALREDVGRHNACDKLIGHMLLRGQLPLSDFALFVSGRLSFEIVQKAAAAGLSVVAAVSAPSSLAVEAADKAGMTLAGFVREDRFNVYTHPERIKV